VPQDKLLLMLKEGEKKKTQKTKKNSIDYFKCMSLMRNYPQGAS
jgi:hypothetical protein